MGCDGYDQIWRASVTDLHECASQGNESVFSDASDAHSDVASHNGADTSGSMRPQNTDDPQIQVCSSTCTSTAGSLNDFSLILCYRCTGITAERLSGELEYEHGLLSELPGRSDII